MPRAPAGTLGDRQFADKKLIFERSSKVLVFRYYLKYIFKCFTAFLFSCLKALGW